ncbi:uridine diphosphate-N-acetylglucosamine-binding protein YvcK [Demequina sp. TTPB684]|uniref:gluconeogenesis factor YvcK family protein n=1 Tax=unclassified Demequina TaxID=2620311 RepID=UPI001CF1EA11|nr:uridine diphosphate-N-acetylglucosamine-binding protein YvcK [Demequina sp. TMPB413]MCB2411381.1 uridine diphosphate-N-acetylglucosamine-binding protein YvcK [Demequina sp. TTPB684]UPU89347.1 uridine diphosphate-N-acetylglucosamine-binding protein YvcK [Demequina sp. TMPB413]
MRPASVVALGGGHGLHASLSALRHVTDDLTAIVTVADDGGSSGRLREELGIVPPGDLRMALSALCEEGEWGRVWRDVLQTRFSTPGPLDGHALGNLLIAGLWERTGNVVEGLEWVARLLRAEGRVLPLAEEPLQISALVDGGSVSSVAYGQVAVATAGGRISALNIEPSHPRVPQVTLDAIAGASGVVLGPGSWYTSVLVHFLVEPVAQALVEAGSKTVLTLNIAHEDLETEGCDRVDDVRALRRLEPAFRPAVVLADVSHGRDRALIAEIEQWGSRLVVHDMKRTDALDRHDVARLAEAYSQALGGLPD